MNFNKLKYDDMYAGGLPIYGTKTPQPVMRNSKADKIIDRYFVTTGLKLHHVKWGTSVVAIPREALEFGSVEVFVPSEKAIQVGKPELYISTPFYYHALFHEMGHSTMKALGLYYGLPLRMIDFAAEEARAELTAKRLMDSIGMSTPDTDAWTELYLDGNSDDIGGFRKNAFDKRIFSEDALSATMNQILNPSEIGRI